MLIGKVAIVRCMSSDPARSLREWLKNERRLGIRHVDSPPPADATGRPAESAAGPPAGAAASFPHRGPNAATPRATPAPGEPRADRAIPATKFSTTPRPTDDELPPLVDHELPEHAAHAALETLSERFVRGCTRCGLHAGRTQTVFGIGPPRPQVVFVGEGPGADEDREGFPFVGKAGQLLTRMIAAMTLSREQVYICNVVKCRPPGNRTPTEDEMAACKPFLFRQLAILRPKIIVSLGAPASQTLLATTTPIGRLRGTFHDFPPRAYENEQLPPAKLMPTFHPAYLLRSPAEKAKSWHDLQLVMRELGIPTPDLS